MTTNKEDANQPYDETGYALLRALIVTFIVMLVTILAVDHVPDLPVWKLFAYTTAVSVIAPVVRLILSNRRLHRTSRS